MRCRTSIWVPEVRMELHLRVTLWNPKDDVGAPWSYKSGKTDRRRTARPSPRAVSSQRTAAKSWTRMGSERNGESGSG